VIAFVTEFGPYEFGRDGERFAELRRILEKRATAVLRCRRRDGGNVMTNGTRRSHGECVLVSLRLIVVQPLFEESDGGDEVVAELSQQVDVVQIPVAGEAVGEIVAGIDGGEQFAAVWAEEDEAPAAELRRRAVAAEGGDGDGHRQVIADSPQQFGGAHRAPDCFRERERTYIQADGAPPAGV
jgi:hypothetical protein